MICKKRFMFLLLLFFIVFVFFNTINIKAANTTSCVLLPDGTIYCGDNPPVNPITPISLNDRINVNLGYGEEKIYSYTLSDSKYYTIETYGNYNTYMTVENLSIGSISDDNSGGEMNASISFSGEPQVTILIKVRFNSSKTYGTFQLQIRKQQFLLYGFDYPGGWLDGEFINTLPDLTEPYNYMKNIYNSYKYENKEYTHLLSLDERGISRINSEVIMFSGHGLVSADESETGLGVSFQNSQLSVSGLSYYNMNMVKLIVWSACYSASSNNSYNTSMVEESINAGAQSAIGFPDSVSSISARSFTNNIFEYMSQGDTVYIAANKAANDLILPWDNVKDYVIMGNTNIKLVVNQSINLDTIYPSSHNSDMNNSKEILNYLNEGFKQYKLNDNDIRYYKVVNDLLTTIYYDVSFDDSGNILNITHYGDEIKHIKKIKSRYVDLSVQNSNNSTEFRADNIDRYCIYYNKNGVLIPVEISYVKYINDKSRNIFFDVVCINLNDGTYINYEEINNRRQGNYV